MRQWYERWKKHTVHPNLKVDYFHTIDTKENAYWLGFLYADGFLTRNMSGTIYIRLELSRNDEDIIDKFCQCLGLEKNKKEYRRHEETDSVEMGSLVRKWSTISLDKVSHFENQKPLNSRYCLIEK